MTTKKRNPLGPMWHRLSKLWRPPIEPITILDEKEWQRQHDEVSTTIQRLMLAITTFSFFCLLTLGAPDIQLIVVDAKIKLPFANTEIDFNDFLWIGPLTLIALAAYLQIFLGYLNKLSKLRGKHPLPFIFNMHGTLPRILSDLILYWMVPGVLAVFYWKASPQPKGYLLGLVTVVVTAWITFVKIRRFKWGDSFVWKLIQYAYWILFLFCIFFSLWHTSINRSLDLMGADLHGRRLIAFNFYRANLSESILSESILAFTNLSGANLSSANLSGANLSGANLSGANLINANLSGAILSGANLSASNLSLANLSGAILNYTNLRAANLNAANLHKVRNLACEELTMAIKWNSAIRDEELECGAISPDASP